MGKCPTCGQKHIGMGIWECKNCGKQICGFCGIYIFTILKTQPKFGWVDSWFACSQKCLQDFASQVEKHLSSTDAGVSWPLSVEKMSFLVSETLPKLEHQYFGKRFLEFESKAEPFCVSFSHSAPYSALVRGERPKGNMLFERLEKHVRLLVIQNLITTRNFEKAAKLYEENGLYEEAGKTRAMDKEIRFKKTEVSVDLNSLLRQLQEGGIVAVYRCPHCGGKLKIDKDVRIDKLRVCDHCSSEIETMDLADFLRTALS